MTLSFETILCNRLYLLSLQPARETVARSERTRVCLDRCCVRYNVNFTRLLSAQYDAALKLSCAPWCLTAKPFQFILVRQQTPPYTISLQAIAALRCVAPFLSDSTCYGIQFSLSFSGPGIPT
ncbi:hypothetical protein CBL_08147 [Carabus blaptoides fortunei]